jgi:lactaldehyde reductase
VDKYVDIAKAMGVDVSGMSKEAAAQAAVDAVKALAVKVGIPANLRALNVPAESLEALATSAFNDVCTPGNPREVALADVLELYKSVY